MGSAITGCGIGMPTGVLDNDELNQLLGIGDSWILERTGIRSRHIAGPHQSSATLAIEACAAALADAGLEPADIDQVIIATTTPDEQMPGVAPLVQEALGIRGAGAFDLNAACAGFLYALAVGDSLIGSGTARRVLVCGSDVMSRVTDYTDRNTCVLFGDGAGAVVLERIEEESRIGPFTFGSDGSGAHLLHIPPSRGLVEMQGREVYRRAVEKMSSSIEEMLFVTGLRSEDVDLLLGHQANERILTAVAERVGMTGRAFVNIGEWGNTSAASIPIALTEAAAAGSLQPDDIVVLAAFGAGFAWGSGLVRWGAHVKGEVPVTTERLTNV